LPLTVAAGALSPRGALWTLLSQGGTDSIGDDYRQFGVSDRDRIGV
jgi:hypothetical protein